MALLITAEPVVQGLISAHWPDHVKTVPVVPARALYSQHSFEGKNLFVFPYVGVDMSSCGIAAIKSIPGRF